MEFSLLTTTDIYYQKGEARETLRLKPTSLASKDFYDRDSDYGEGDVVSYMTIKNKPQGGTPGNYTVFFRNLGEQSAVTYLREKSWPFWQYLAKDFFTEKISLPGNIEDDEIDDRKQILDHIKQNSWVYRLQTGIDAAKNGEYNKARTLLKEVQNDIPESKPLYFRRLPDFTRIMMLEAEGRYKEIKPLIDPIITEAEQNADKLYGRTFYLIKRVLLVTGRVDDFRRIAELQQKVNDVDIEEVVVGPSTTAQGFQSHEEQQREMNTVQQVLADYILVSMLKGKADDLETYLDQADRLNYGSNMINGVEIEDAVYSRFLVLFSHLIDNPLYSEYADIIEEQREQLRENVSEDDQSKAVVSLIRLGYPDEALALAKDLLEGEYYSSDKTSFLQAVLEKDMEALKVTEDFNDIPKPVITVLINRFLFLPAYQADDSFYQEVKNVYNESFGIFPYVHYNKYIM